jgi:16S rRNA (guanine527-N7)-methyltransferase
MPSPYSAEDFARDLSVPRATLERVEAYRAQLAEASQRMNLIGPNELENFWDRHALDCGQLVRLAPDARRWLDLGSGAGLPGIIIACMLTDEPGAEIHMIEATAKKAQFLRETIQALNLPAEVFNLRIEDFAATPQGAGQGRYDVVTARAVAPLKRLIDYAKPILASGAQGLFHKGAGADAELAAAKQALDGGASGVSYRADVLESMSSPRGRIIRIAAR